MFLKQSTSAVVLVGPVLDASGVAVTTAVIGDFTLSKNGTSAAMSGNTISHAHNGHYAITLTAANTDTIGRLTISVNNTAQAMPVFRWDICQPTVYDALFTNAVNTSGGLPAATGAITALAGAVSTYAGGDTAGTTTLLTRLPSAISLSGGAVTVGTNNDKTGYSLTAGTGLGNQTANITGNLSGSVGSVTGAVGSVTAGVTVTTNNDKTGYSLTQAFPTNFSSLAITAGGAVTAGTVSDKTGYSLSSTGLAAVTSWTVGITGNITGNLSGSVGSISGVTFPAHFDNLDIAANGHVTATVDAINNNAITAASIQANAITAAKIATDAIGAAQLAADAVTEIQSGLATAANLLVAIDRVSYCLSALAGSCSDAQTAAETYVLSIGGNTYTVDYSGLDASGNRGTTTLTKA